MNLFFQQFLESSTIHGLVYISTESRFTRLFWILVVITGFSIATYMISDAFEGWSEHSIKTTTETRDISEIRFPVVTVCPQNNTFTHLNYDLMNLDNMTMTDETKHKQQFLDIANQVFLESYFFL